MRAQSGTWAAQQDGEVPAEEGCFLVHYVPDAGVLTLPLSPPRYQGICPHLEFPKRRPQTRVQGQVAYREGQVTPVEKGDVIQEGTAAEKGCVITATTVGSWDIIPRKMLGNPDLQNAGLRIIPPRKGVCIHQFLFLGG